MLTAVMLFGPKLMGALIVWMRPTERASFGGGWRLLAGLLAELVMSAVLAPSHMLSSCRAVAETLFGRDRGWSAQRRRVGETPWTEAWRCYGWQSAAGVVLLMIVAPYSDLVIWMAPIIIGLVFAAPIAAVTASASVGAWARSVGVFTTPDEIDPPTLLRTVVTAEAVPDASGVAETAPSFA